MAGLQRMRGGTVAVVPSFVFGGPKREKSTSVTVSVPNVRAFCETSLVSMGVPEAKGFAAALIARISSASGDEEPRPQNQAIISRVEGFLCRFRLGLGFPDLVVDGR